MTKTERRLKRIEERLEALEKVLPITGWAEEAPKTSVMDRIYDKAVEAGVDVDQIPEEPPGPFGVVEELQEEGEKKPKAKPMSKQAPDAPEPKNQIKDPGLSPTKSGSKKLSASELEEAAYNLRESGLEWSEVEEELGVRSPWLAAGRYRKRLEKIAMEGGEG